VVRLDEGELILATLERFLTEQHIRLERVEDEAQGVAILQV
jgi:hypothetical protein